MGIGKGFNKQAYMVAQGLPAKSLKNKKGKKALREGQNTNPHEGDVDGQIPSQQTDVKSEKVLTPEKLEGDLRALRRIDKEEGQGGNIGRRR